MKYKRRCRNCLMTGAASFREGEIDMKKKIGYWINWEKMIICQGTWKRYISLARPCIGEFSNSYFSLRRSMIKQLKKEIKNSKQKIKLYQKSIEKKSSVLSRI